MTGRYPAITDIEIVPIRPRPVDEAYLANVARRRGGEQRNVAWIVKIGLDELPPPRGSAMLLVLGDEIVRRYGQFSRGIFLLIHDPAFFAAHAGASIRFSYGGPERYDTGWHFPRAPITTEGVALSSFEDALEGSMKGRGGHEHVRRLSRG